MASEADEQTLRNIVEAAPDGIVVVDTDGRIRIVNAQVEELFGYARGELIGELIEMLVPEAARSVHASHRAAYVRRQAMRPMRTSLDLRGRRKDGSEFPVEISLSPMQGVDGLLVTAIVRDVTAQRQDEEDRQRLLGEVEAQLVRDEVARDLHDDIIQAVYAVGLNLQAATTQDELSKNQALDRAQRELGAVIADLRSYIRHLTVGRSDVAPHLLETRLRTLLEQRQGPPSWTVTIELSNLPRGSLDRDLYLLARELISNVERHAGTSRASFSLEVGDSAVHLQVQDSGRGFDRAVVRDASVGLRSVEERVAQLGGSVFIDSKPDQGTTVTAKIPLPEQPAS
jgi:PAS domain S-box-containing protein